MIDDELLPGAGAPRRPRPRAARTAEGRARLVARYRRRFYPDGRPSGLARALNGLSARVHALGVWPGRLVTLRVRGRRTGRLVSFPMVMVGVAGERYLVSMLGERANRVHNLHADGGRALLVHGRREEVHLDEVDVAERAPVLRRYLECAPGARPHIPVDRRAPLAAFAEVASRYPVFRVRPVTANPVAGTSRTDHR